jgi:hypothetical protein
VGVVGVEVEEEDANGESVKCVSVHGKMKKRPTERKMQRLRQRQLRLLLPQVINNTADLIAVCTKEGIVDEEEVDDE